MKTRIVSRPFSDEGRYERGFEPQDSPDGKGVPRYVPAHRATGWNGHAKEWDEPEAVYTRTGGYHPKRGKLPMIRTIPDTYVEQLHDLDTKRETLRKMIVELDIEERGILKDAYAVGKPLELATVKEWTAARKKA